MAGNNPTDESQDQLYSLDDPALLNNMKLVKDVKRSDRGNILRTRGTELTAVVVEGLKRRGIKEVYAIPVAAEKLTGATEEMEKMFNILESVVSVPGQSVQAAAETFQKMEEVRALEGLVKTHMQEIFHLFNPHAADGLIQLQSHHPNTANHSIISGFNAMAIGKELGWDEPRTIEAAMATMKHDIGKVNVKLDTLDWPGRLNKKQWAEIQLHSLFGGRLLFQGQWDSSVVTALTHHEWYANVKGKGYGALTLFRKYVVKDMGIEIDDYLATAKKADLEILHVSAIADMVSALEETRSYKGELVPFKVLVIMNSDAGLGHFEPNIYRAWHRSYCRKHPNLLPQGLQVPLPREKEKKVFQKGRVVKFAKPRPFLSLRDLKRLRLLEPLAQRRVDLDRLRRNGGILKKQLLAYFEKVGPIPNLSDANLEKMGVKPLKKQAVLENQMIGLDVKESRFSFDELEESGLLQKMKCRMFDIDLVRKEGGISLDRLVKRDVQINWKKLEKLGIDPNKQQQITLPAFEERLTLADLEKLGYTKKKLHDFGVYDRLEQQRGGLRLDYLAEKGIHPKKTELREKGIKTEQKIFYDILVVESLDRTRGRFAIMREREEFADLEKIAALGELDTLQSFLYHKIGIVEIDFSDVLDLPASLDSLEMGDHWRVSA
ncbi:MAG: hypothetical protein HQL52_14350 [Magnetococcales bacterium]|nr:hypothetical protein [Magnetococcales bacterium]